MDDAAVAWLRRLVTRALDMEPAVFDAMLTAKPRRTSFRTADNQLEVPNADCAGDVRGEWAAV
jgi:hypothetical protein